MRWCRDNDINLCGTTRHTHGFPTELQFDGMQVLCFALMLMMLFVVLLTITHTVLVMFFLHACSLATPIGE